MSTGVTVSETHVVTIFEDLDLHEDGTATRYGLDGPEIKSRWRLDFPYPSRPPLGTTQPPVQCASSPIPGKVEGGRWRWPPTPIYCPDQRNSSSIHLLPCWVFMASARVNVFTVSTWTPLWGSEILRGSEFRRDVPPEHPYVLLLCHSHTHYLQCYTLGGYRLRILTTRCANIPKSSRCLHINST